VTANYTVQILPTVQQDVFYELCGLTLKTIFDLRLPGTSKPVAPLFSLAGNTIATQAVSCPSLTAATTAVSQGFGCAPGEILRKSGQALPECGKTMNCISMFVEFLIKNKIV